jgi:hypothetical protein
MARQILIDHCQSLIKITKNTGLLAKFSQKIDKNFISISQDPILSPDLQKRNTFLNLFLIPQF